MIEFEKNKIYLHQESLDVEFPVQQVGQFGDLIIVLFRPESFRGAGQFRNLVAYDLRSKEKIWVAELPTNYSMDAYYQLLPGPNLVADSLCSYRCHLNLADGRILSKEFFK